jgi:hypothetical protein
MAINYIKGQILADNLERDGIDLAFDTNLVYLDVGSSAVGINTTTPVSTLEVVGNITIGNIVIPNVGNVNLANTYINNLLDPVDNQDAATKKYVLDNVGNIGSAGNLTFSNTTISTSLANGNITLAATGADMVTVAGSLGLNLPVGNTAQQPETAVQGTLRFNSETVQLEVYNGSIWVAATNEQSVITNQTITPDGSSISYTLDQTTTADAILLTINGISQTPVIDYTVAGNALTLTTTPLTSDIIQVRFIAATTAISGVTLPGYTVSQAQALPSVSTGQMIYVTNGDSGNPCLAVYSDGAFRRISFGANIST